MEYVRATHTHKRVSQILLIDIAHVNPERKGKTDEKPWIKAKNSYV